MFASSVAASWIIVPIYLPSKKKKKKKTQLPEVCHICHGGGFQDGDQR